MKISGSKIVFIFSALMLGLMLIVPVLPAIFSPSETDSCNRSSEEINVEKKDFKDSSQVFIGFSIGSEISISL